MPTFVWAGGAAFPQRASRMGNGVFVEFDRRRYETGVRITMAMAFLARRCEARMGLALAVHVKGFGFWLRCSIHSSIAASSSATLWKMPRRMRWRVISAKSRSTRLSHELDVGVKWSLKRLCLASQRFTFSVLCVA